MTERRRALVVGATGVVGRNLLRHLLAIGGWDVLAVSRRKPDVEGDYEHLSLDLLDRPATQAALGTPRGITHVFYSAYIERPTWIETTAPNVAMFENLLDAIEPASPGLAHVNLMEGTKWYGNHLGPFKTPAREDDPRHMPPNFYYDQQDLVVARQRGKRWTWSAARPHAICGFAVGNPMNLAMVIAIYATLSKAIGMPLRHPGIEANWRALYQCTDAELLARGTLWMATEPRCGNEAFNITNGDLIRWEYLWPAIARHFGMEAGPRQHICLAEMMRDKAPLWDRLVAEHGLRPIPYDQIASWKFGDFVFSAGFDIISSMTKARRYGFHEVVDTEEMFLRIFDQLRSDRIIP
ncbi:MAG: SDR family oxidoreductase [Acetobacteraceae bacterium]|nr:SDR family oxidoreductase [Acetobacteraceae bacterium]